MAKSNGLVTRTRTSITLPTELLKYMRDNDMNITKRIRKLLEKDMHDELEKIGYVFDED